LLLRASLGNVFWSLLPDRKPPLGDRPLPVFLDGGTVNTSLGSDEIVGEGDSSEGQAEGALLTDARLFMSNGNDDFKGTGEDGADGTPEGSVGASPLTLPKAGDGAAGDAGADGVVLTNSKLDTGFGLFRDDDVITGVGGKGGDGSAGGAGGAGADGQAGGHGGDGGDGGNSAIIPGRFAPGGVGGDAGDGGNGGVGGNGGNGGLGGNGGDGGNGIVVDANSKIDTGFGDDVITGVGGMYGSGGAGGDAGAPGSGGAGGDAGEAGQGGRNDDFTIFNLSRAADGADGVAGGDGDNGIVGSAGNSGVDGKQGYAIYNEGKIDTGVGRDTIDAMNGGFGGGGKYFLGLGRDTVKGFGHGTFYGGFSRDTLMLPGQQSDYDINFGFFKDEFTKDGVTMVAWSFENIQFTG
jgi:hypothetical protein